MLGGVTLWKDKKKNNEYKARVCKSYITTFSRISETDLIEHMEKHRPCNAYLKELVRRDMEATK